MSTTRPTEPLPHFLLFWGLAGLGVAAAVPCLVVPPIEALQLLHRAEGQLAQRVQILERETRRREELCSALRCDPQINGRLALRDLRYRHSGTVQLVAAPIMTRPAAESVAPAEPTPMPWWVLKLYPARWAAPYRLAPPRYLILAMSLGLVVFAVWTYRPLPVTRQPR